MRRRASTNRSVEFPTPILTYMALELLTAPQWQDIESPAHLRSAPVRRVTLAATKFLWLAASSSGCVRFGVHWPPNERITPYKPL